MADVGIPHAQEKARPVVEIAHLPAGGPRGGEVPPLRVHPDRRRDGDIACPERLERHRR